MFHLKKQDKKWNDFNSTVKNEAKKTYYFSFVFCFVLLIFVVCSLTLILLFFIHVSLVDVCVCITVQETIAKKKFTVIFFNCMTVEFFFNFIFYLMLLLLFKVEKWFHNFILSSENFFLFLSLALSLILLFIFFIISFVHYHQFFLVSAFGSNSIHVEFLSF